MSISNLNPGTFEVPLPTETNNVSFPIAPTDFMKNQKSGFEANKKNEYHLIDWPVSRIYSKPNQQFEEQPISKNQSIGKNQKNYAYRMLAGNEQVTEFSLLYFSFENISEIQKLIKYKVYKVNGSIIDRQSEYELVVIMTGIYMDYSRIPNNRKEYTHYIAYLNDLVVQKAVRLIVSEINQQKRYTYDRTHNLSPNEYGKNTSVAGTRNIRDMSDVIFSKTSNVFPANYN